MSHPIPGRAETPEQKRRVMEQVLAYWLANPKLRLGQLLQDAVDVRGQNLFYVEDDKLVEFLKSFTGKFGG